MDNRIFTSVTKIIMKECFWLCYFLAHKIIDLTGSIQSNSCQSFASKLSVPIVNFCENNQAETAAVLLMDGSLAESIPTVASCSCVITTSNATTLTFTHSPLVPLEITQGCGSEISVINNKKFGILMECIVQGSIQITTGEYLNVVLTKNKDANTNYCVYIFQGDGNARINATCSKSTNPIGTDITTSTSKTYVTEYSTEQISLHTPIVTEETLTKTHFSLTDTSLSASQSSTSTSTFLSTDYKDTYNRTKENFVSISTDSNKILYYAIGIGGSGVVVVIVIVITVVLCRRKRLLQESLHNQYNDLQISQDTDMASYSYLTPSITKDLDYEEVSPRF